MDSSKLMELGTTTTTTKPYPTKLMELGTRGYIHFYCN